MRRIVVVLLIAELILMHQNEYGMGLLGRMSV